jgi:hypothetical protein
MSVDAFFANLPQYLAAGLLVFGAVAVPLGLLGTVIEHFGRVFGLPRVEAFGQKLEDFFTNVPALLKGRR